jgi:hypothetical protein
VKENLRTTMRRHKTISIPWNFISRMHGCFRKTFNGTCCSTCCQYHNTKSRKVEPRSTPTLSTSTEAMATLGISTNTRLVGLAIIINGELEAYKIQLHKSSWCLSKATQIITCLEACAQQYSINQVVLSIPPKHYQTNEFRYLLSQIKTFFERQGIPVFTESVQALHVFCNGHGRKTKRKVMQALSERFPELQTCYQKELRNKNKYYVKVFEAVGIALLHDRQ